jgi:hypothetical protein
MSSNLLPRAVLALLVASAAAALPCAAQADEPTFGPHDVPTAFFISKSDDHNRVDYAIRLTENCSSSSENAVLPYWREFEKAPPVRTHPLGYFEWVPYGFKDQRMLKRTPTGGQHFMRLKQFPERPIVIFTKKEPDGKCSAVAHAMINGKEAILVSMFVKLCGALCVDYVDVHGKDLETGAAIEERLRK